VLHFMWLLLSEHATKENQMEPRSTKTQKVLQRVSVNSSHGQLVTCTNTMVG